MTDRKEVEARLRREFEQVLEDVMADRLEVFRDQLEFRLRSEFEENVDKAVEYELRHGEEAA